MRNKKLKKRLIILGVVAVLLTGGIIGGVQYMNYKNDQKTVEVVPMMYVSNTYWGDQTSSSGNIVADYMQELYPDSSRASRWPSGTPFYSITGRAWSWTWRPRPLPRSRCRCA